jgi:glyoxylase-like metal-dependent hydrolase (beta-lactamase superfamily II)
MRVHLRGKTVMLDCGIHPGFTGPASLPYFDEVEMEEVDVMLVTHFHLDHVAAVPYVATKTTFKVCRHHCFTDTQQAAPCGNAWAEAPKHHHSPYKGGRSMLLPVSSLSWPVKMQTLLLHVSRRGAS